MPSPTRRVMIFRSLPGGAAALAASIAGWARPAQAADARAAESAGAALARTTSIPVGGGKIVKGRWVVTQPRRGGFRAFSAVCTHQGCTVAEVSRGTINRPCHGSRFHIFDGSVVRGPASQSIRVSKGVIRLR